MPVPPAATELATFDMRAATEAFDWSSTPLGPRDGWPLSLRTAVDIMLSSGFAMCAAWGPELTFLYNDDYAPVLGARHPDALGKPIRDVWPEIWADIEPLIAEVLSGRTVRQDNMHLVMTRHGHDEDTWWDFSYSPLRDDDGQIAGFLDVTTDCTATVLAQRGLEAESAHLRASEARFRALAKASSDIVYQLSPDWSRLTALDAGVPLVGAEAEATDWIGRLVPGEDQPRVIAAAERAIRSREPYELEHRIRRPDGKISWVWSRAVPMLAPDGSIVEWFGMATDVTERREAREALATSTEKLELAVRAAELGQFDYHPQTGRLEWDDRCRALFGLSPGVPVSFEGSYVAGLHPDDRQVGVDGVAAALDPAGSGRFDLHYRTIGIEDGVERYLHAQGTVTFEGALPVRLVGSVRDVTADRRSRAALQETEERLRLAVRATSDAIWDWDLVRDHVRWNEALEQAHGHAPDSVEPTGAWWIGHIHPDDRERIDASIHAVIDGTQSDWTDEYRFLRGDGSYADIRDRGYVIRDEDGRAVRMIGAMLDQTERKAVERSLTEQVETFRGERDRLWETTTDLMATAGADGYLKDINPAWQRLLGWDEASLLARPILQFIHPDDHAETAAIIQALGQGERASGFVNRAVARDGSIHTIMWHAVPEGDLFYSVGRDVTEQYAAEERLRHSHKMEAVGQLTGGIAHDFNNMLTGVLGSLELLKRYLAEGRADRVERYITAATGSAERAAGLTQRLLAFSRRQSLDVQPVDVNAAVTRMEELLGRTLGENIEVELALDPNAWLATTDANQLESALLNLAINARDAMPDGGTLTVRSANTTLGATETVSGEDVEPGDYVVLTVADTGTGMPPEVLGKVFDPFFTTKPIGQGTGLGLSMIYGFTRQTGGHVRIRSAPDQGTAVSLYLRRHEGAGQIDAPTPIADLPGGQGERVMVVEDDPAVRMLVVDVLEGLGYAVFTAGDGPEALALLARTPSLHLLVTDVGLPGMTGRQLADRVREVRPDLPVLFVTGYAEQARSRAGFLAEGMDMILKPFAIADLADKVRTMVRGDA
jgi:PAS domain S-box-containing protein